MELSILINKFNIKGRLVSLQPFGNGNINDTFLAIYRNTFTETQVILQRVNKNVFPKPEVIMENMHNLTRHCHEKLEDDAQKGRDDRVWQMPRIIKAKDSKDFVVDDKGEVWRVITRIMSAHAFDVAQGPEHAMECGAALGHFHYLISDMDPKEIKDPLPGFHITSGYLKKYDQTLKSKEAKELLKSSMEAKRLAKFPRGNVDVVGQHSVNRVGLSLLKPKVPVERLHIDGADVIVAVGRGESPGPAP